MTLFFDEIAAGSVHWDLKTHGQRCTLIYVEQAREKEERSWLAAHKAAAGGKLTEAAGAE